MPDNETLLNSVPGFVAVIDQQLTLLAVYGAQSGIIRRLMSAQESQYLPVIFEPEYQPEIVSMLQAAFATGDPTYFEAQLADLNTWYENHVTPQNSVDCSAYLVIVGNDITPYRRLESELEAQRQFLDGLLQTIPGWVAVYDHDEQKSIFANQYMVNFHGVPLDMTKRHSYVMESTIHPDDYERVLHYGYHVLPEMEDGEVVAIEYRGRAADGTWRWLDIRDTVLKRHSDGTVWQTLGVALDVTDRKEIEAELLDVQLRYQAIFDQSNDAILISTFGGDGINKTELLAANLKALQLLDYTFEELQSLEYAATLTIAPEEEHQAQNNRERVVSGEQLPVYERTAVNKQGQHIPVEVNMIVVRDNHDKPVYAVAIFRDVSERKRQEAAVRDSERFARSTVDALSAHIAILDEHGTIVTVNKAWREFAEKNGAKCNVGDGVNYLAVCDAATDDLAEARTFAQGIRAVLSGEIEKFEMEYGCHSPDEKRWFVGRVTRFSSGSPVSVVVAHEDVTERKKRELQLRYYTSLQETVSDAVISTDMDLCIRSWNRAAEKIYGWRVEEVLGKSVSDLLQTSYETDAIGDTALRDLLQDGAWQGEAIQRHKNGTELHILGSITVFRDESGTPIGMVGINHDVTERKRIQEELRESERHYRALAHNFPNGMVALYDQDLRFILADGQGLSEYQLTSEQIEGRPVGEIWSQETADVFGPQMRVVFQGQSLDTETQYLDRYYKILTTPIRDDRGKITAGLVMTQNITERKRQEQALEQAVDLARTASAAKSTFLAHMSHELRTPLNAILGYAQLLANEANLEDSVRQRLTAIDHSGQHLLQIINDVLDMARVETGRVALNNTSVDLSALLENLRLVFIHRADQKRLQLELDLAPGLPRHVLTDEGKLRQILTNLVGNAIKFTEFGSITLRGTFMSEDSRAGRLFLAVQDTGHGIHPDQFDRLFQPFEQLSVDDVGTGLGLSISRNFARLMGGDIHVNSTPGSGSTFTLELPVELADDPGLRSDTLEIIGLAPHQPESNILVVEDNDDSLKMLMDTLQSIGLSAQPAADGQAALEMYQRTRPNILLLDMQLPRVDGYEVARRIRQDYHDQKTIIIAVTASAFVQQKTAILDSGCTDLLTKPFTRSQLFACLAQHTGMKFLYRQTSSVATIDNSPPNFDVELFAHLSQSQLRELHQAALAGSSLKAREFIERIQDEHPLLAERLSITVDRFWITALADQITPLLK